jgi:hypothetical protein
MTLGSFAGVGALDLLTKIHSERRIQMKWVLRAFLLLAATIAGLQAWHASRVIIVSTVTSTLDPKGGIHYYVSNCRAFDCDLVQKLSEEPQTTYSNRLMELIWKQQAIAIAWIVGAVALLGGSAVSFLWRPKVKSSQETEHDTVSSGKGNSLSILR